MKKIKRSMQEQKEQEEEREDKKKKKGLTEVLSVGVKRMSLNWTLRF